MRVSPGFCSGLCSHSVSFKLDLILEIDKGGSASVPFKTLDLMMKCRAINHMLACQHPNGGFSGGPGQSPHLLPTYAAVCAMAIVGRPGPDGGWDQIDR